MARGSSFGCSLLVAVVVIVGGGIYDLFEWLFTKPVKPLDAAHQMMKDTGDAIADRAGLVRTIKVSGKLTREKFDEGTQGWVAAGTVEVEAVYDDGADGRVYMKCLHEEGIGGEAVEGGAAGVAVDRSFESVFDGTVGATVIRNADGTVVADLEKGRPPEMEAGDEATGWRYSFYGRWRGPGGELADVQNLLTGAWPGAVVTADQMGEYVKVHVVSKGVEEVVWIGTTDGYSFDKWEVGAAGAPAGVEGGVGGRRLYVDVPRFWYVGDVWYPHAVTVVRYGEKGQEAERESIETTGFVLNPGKGEQARSKMRVDVPGGKMKLIEGGKVTELEGTEEENDKAVSEAWGRMEG